MAKAKGARMVQEADRFVGQRIRERRIMLGLTQAEMAERIGVTFQQAHKYEHGTTRVSAGRLFAIAQALGVPVSYFYEGMESGAPPTVTPRRRMMLELARNFAAIESPRQQEVLAQLARVLAHD